MVRPDYCAVDHLQAGVAAAAVVEGFEQQLPQAGQRPATELAVNRRPFAEMLVKVAPCNACPRDPENPIKNKAMVPRTTPAPRTALDHEGLKTDPFLVTHQTPDHGSLLKSYLESDTTLFGNPLCQHYLAFPMVTEIKPESSDPPLDSDIIAWLSESASSNFKAQTKLDESVWRRFNDTLSN